MSEVTKDEKRKWSKIINKNKDGLIIVPPHDKTVDIPTVTLTWEEFNANFDIDPTNKTRCFVKEESIYIKKFEELPTTKRTVDYSKPKKTTDENKKKFSKKPRKTFKKHENDSKNDSKPVETNKPSFKKVTELKKDVKKPIKKDSKPKETKPIDTEYTMSIGDMIKGKK